MDNMKDVETKILTEVKDIEKKVEDKVKEVIVQDIVDKAENLLKNEVSKVTKIEYKHPIFWFEVFPSLIILACGLIIGYILGQIL